MYESCGCDWAKRMTRQEFGNMPKEEKEGFRILRVFCQMNNEMITTTNMLYMDCTTTLNQTSSNVLRVTAWFDSIARA